MRMLLRQSVFDAYRDGIPRALLFCGQEGVGKVVTAKALAEHYTNSLYVTYMRNVSVDGIRSIKKEAGISTLSGEPRFFIVVLDGLHSSSYNALLKVLEEPLDGVYFILIHSKGNVPLTVWSRCFRVFFPRYSNSEICTMLTNSGMSFSDAQKISSMSCGSMTRVVELMEHADERRGFLEAVHLLRDGESELYLSKTRNFTDYQSWLLLSWLRCLLCYKAIGDAGLMDFRKEDFYGFDKEWTFNVVRKMLNGIWKISKPSLRFMYFGTVLGEWK